MGVDSDSILLYEQGKQKKVEKMTAKAVFNMSKYTIKERPLRYEADLAIYHSSLSIKYHYPPARMRTYVTQDNYVLSATDDVEVLTLNGWKRLGEVEVGEMIYSNGVDIPAYKDKESLKRLYIDQNMTQGEIGEMFGIPTRTIRYYIQKFGLDKGLGPRMIGEDNPMWKGDEVSKKGGYERTHAKFNRIKTGVCSRCGRTLPTQLHHDDRNPINIDDSNLMELCDLCHAMEHHGNVVKWVRPAKITEIRYGGIDESYGFVMENSDNAVVDGFILRFPTDTADNIITMEKI